MKRRAFGWILLAAATALAWPAVTTAQDPSSLRPAITARYPAVQWVTTASLARWVARDAERRPILLDSRPTEEFSVSHLRRARRVDPELTDVASLGLERDDLIVVYCSVGWRSGGIADRLRAAGYTRVYNLEGGLFQWANEGRAFYRGNERASQVHPYDAIWGRLLNERYRAPL